jgi:DNA repair protein RadC
MAMSKARVLNEANGAYLTDDEVIRLAVSILQHRFGLKRTHLNSPGTVRDYLVLTLTGREHEQFCCVYLDAQNRVIAFEELFRGTLTQTSIYPREIVKRALAHNAASLIFAHNHPSGIAEPSRSDEALTQSLKQSLALIDVKVLDHFIIGEGVALSMAERGLI